MTFRNINLIYSLLFLLTFTLSSFSQSISGKILSEKSEPIPFATIQIGENYGVISNDEGNFSISTADFKATDSVTISCLGYEKLGMQLQEFISQDYILKEHLNELSEVYVTDRKLGVDSIMYYVNKNLNKNYKVDLQAIKFFGRRTDYIVGKTADFEIEKSSSFKKKQLEAFNKDFDALEQSLINNKSKQYTDAIATLYILNANKAKLDVEKSVRLLDERNDQSLEKLAEKGNDIVLNHLDRDKVYTVKSGWFKVSDSVSLDNRSDKMGDSINSANNVKNATFGMIKNSIFSGDEPELDFVTESKKYKYELKDLTFLNNEIVYIINFKPKRGSAKYVGTLYISNETFAIIRADYKFYEGRVGEKLNLRLILGIKYVEQNKSGSISYKKRDNGLYYPYYISEQVDRYFYVNRPIKFIDNDNSNNKVAFNFKIEGVFKERSEMLTMEIDDIISSDYQNAVQTKAIEFQNIKKYDPSIWSDYNVLEPLEDMKNFKVEE
ncbi:carboxypeptidase-like regulatory domain-containing protein [Hanstruepera marina]|uniref:carboxypeptidase-like regulatory domain-containing protein n=1 Tax=Hanstruepera marina TaxID=2873265 RepID=UPI001CA70C7E|nr:carboxypeptidase-like regulatory domain-containing protein [Hanstruepera marina]